jgi:hypothetical protein
MQRGIHLPQMGPKHMMSFFSGKGQAAAMTSKAFMKEEARHTFVLHIQIAPPSPTQEL